MGNSQCVLTNPRFLSHQSHIIYHLYPQLYQQITGMTQRIPLIYGQSMIPKVLAIPCRTFTRRAAFSAAFVARKRAERKPRNVVIYMGLYSWCDTAQILSKKKLLFRTSVWFAERASVLDKPSFLVYIYIYWPSETISGPSNMANHPYTWISTEIG